MAKKAKKTTTIKNKITHFKKSKSVIHRTNRDGSIVVMNLKNEETFYKLTGLASDIWSKIEKKKNTDALIKDLQREYDVEEKKLSKMVLTYLKQFQGLGLIESV